MSANLAWPRLGWLAWLSSALSFILWQVSFDGDARVHGESPITPRLFQPLLMPSLFISYCPKLVTSSLRFKEWKNKLYSFRGRNPLVMLQKCKSGEGQRIRAFGTISFQLTTCFRMIGSDCQYYRCWSPIMFGPSRKHRSWIRLGRVLLGACTFYMVGDWIFYLESARTAAVGI